MHRWWGSKDDADQQASERNSRAARRAIQALPLVPSDSSEDEYNDCDTSLLFSIGVDGADDGVSEDDMPVDAAQAAAELARQRALPVEDSNFEDDPDSWKKEIKLKFDPNDVHYWFNSVEAEMKKYGINSQWEKKGAIVPLLPDEIRDEVKPLLRLTQTEAGDSIYKDVKTEILALYGPREEDAFKKAIALKMTGKPSAFGKRLIHIVCPGARPFNNCHCARMVYGFWEAQLSAPIKTALAGKKFNKDTYQTLFKLADEAWLANGGASSTVIGAVTKPDSNPSSSPQDSAQVAAVSSRGGRGTRGGRGAPRAHHGIIVNFD